MNDNKDSNEITVTFPLFLQAVLCLFLPSVDVWLKRDFPFSLFSCLNLLFGEEYFREIERTILGIRKVINFRTSVERNPEMWMKYNN